MLRRTKKVKSAFTAKRIARRIEQVAGAIREDAGNDEVFLLGVLKGAAFLVADLMRAIPGRASYGFIDVIRDSSDTVSALEIDFLSFTDIAGRHVYVVKDVVSTGIIENYLLTQLRQRRPASIKLVALLDRPDARTVELATDYKIFEVHDGSFVGYGLEMDGQYGNLPYIGKL